jgi:hypothetical protein
LRRKVRSFAAFNTSASARRICFRDVMARLDLEGDGAEDVLELDFVAGARPKKVFDFGTLIPDPLYGTAGALQFMSLGLYNAQGFHDFMDLQMSTQHSRVHQALMEGSAKVFAAWLKEK